MFNAWMDFEFRASLCNLPSHKRRKRRGARNVVSDRALSYYAEGVGPVPRIKNKPIMRVWRVKLKPKEHLNTLFFNIPCS